MDEFMETLRGMLPKAKLLDRAAFLMNLVFMYQVIRASEDLLSEAAYRTSGVLHGYLRRHLEEETNHATWLRNDLSLGGVDVDAMPIWPEAVAMVGSQYYLIRHVDPAALLGYMLVLECFPMPVKEVEELERVHGADLCRTLRHHAIHDPDHGKEVLEQIERFTETQRELAKQNAVQTVHYLQAAAAKFNGGAYA